MSDAFVGTCEICKKENVGLSRKYWRYLLKCECHSPTHSESIEYCSECESIVYQFEPEFTTPLLKGITSNGESYAIRVDIPTRALVCNDRESKHHKLDTDKEIFFYEQEFYVFSNFSAFAVEY